MPHNELDQFLVSDGDAAGKDYSTILLLGCMDERLAFREMHGIQSAYMIRNAGGIISRREGDDISAIEASIILFVKMMKAKGEKAIIAISNHYDCGMLKDTQAAVLKQNNGDTLSCRAEKFFVKSYGYLMPQIQEFEPGKEQAEVLPEIKTLHEINHALQMEEVRDAIHEGRIALVGFMDDPTHNEENHPARALNFDLHAHDGAGAYVDAKDTLGVMLKHPDVLRRYAITQPIAVEKYLAVREPVRPASPPHEHIAALGRS